jgi:hypothetical protein
VGLGTAICNLLSLGSVSDEVGVLSERTNSFHFPKKQVVPIVATSVTYLCPSHKGAVEAYQKHPPAPPQSASPPPAAPTTAPPPAPTTAPPGPALTQQQRSAVEAAKQYLATEPFSQQGLIDQLDSSAGSGYAVNDATVAVDSLTVNWNAEAVQAAKDYLQTQPFSCTDLIQQLDSSAGDQFTAAQATYGATQAGDCGGGVPAGTSGSTGSTGSTGNTP